mgnify:FL=1
MAYCTNCGQPLMGQAKFCPGCGTKVVVEQMRTFATGYKEKMYKGVEQQLKSSLRSYAKSTVQKNVSRMTEKGISAVQEAISNSLSEKEASAVDDKSTSKKIKTESGDKKSTHVAEPPFEEVKGGVTIWTWLYLIVSVIIGFRGYYANEILRILLVSLIVLLMVLIRRKKAKPYNWLTKLIILVQMVLGGYILYQHVMYQFFTFTSLLLAALLYIDFTLLFNGNKKKK